VIADHYLRQRGQMGEARPGRFGGGRLRRAGHVNDIHQRVETILAAFAKGEIVVVADDDDRRERGRFSSPASHCTPEKMAFIIRNTSGIVCAPLSQDEAKRLHPTRWWRHDAPLGTASRCRSTCATADHRDFRRRALQHGACLAMATRRADFVRRAMSFRWSPRRAPAVLMRSATPKLPRVDPLSAGRAAAPIACSPN